MIVMKFGGSSLQDADGILNVARIIKIKIPLQPVIVASAMGKTTRKLLNSCLAAVNQDQSENQNILQSLRDYHFNAALKLDLFNVDAEFDKTMRSYFSAIESNLELIKSTKSLSPKLQDSTLAFGELLSTLILSTCLRSIGVNAQLFDARKCVVTDSHFSHATPLESESYAKINDYLSPSLLENRVAVIQGFIGATESGETTTLGFEGSDYSAVLIGAALCTKEVQIWKDVPGVMSADPELIKSAIPVERMNFTEATELSRCGAKVLHPSTIKPASDLNIPVKILNSYQPDFKGTTINRTISDNSNLTKSITYRRALTILNITAKHSLSEFDFSTQVFVTLHDLEMTPEIVQRSDKKVILIIKNSELKKSFFNHIAEWADVQIEKGKATISIIGNMIRSNHKIVQKFQTFNDDTSFQIDVDKTSDHSYTMLLNETDLDAVMQELHHDLFEVTNKRQEGTT